MSDLSVQDDGMAPPSLADVLKKIRGSTKQVTFAESVGISSAMIGHVEAGSRSLSVENVEKIIRSLNLDADTAVALRRARDRMSNAKEPSIPAQLAKMELTLGRQLDRIEETVTRLADVLDADRLGSLEQEVIATKDGLKQLQRIVTGALEAGSGAAEAGAGL